MTLESIAPGSDNLTVKLTAVAAGASPARPAGYRYRRQAVTPPAGTQSKPCFVSSLIVGRTSYHAVRCLLRYPHIGSIKTTTAEIKQNNEKATDSRIRTS